MINTELKKYELDVLDAIKKISSQKKKPEFYSVCEELSIENTNIIIPVLYRLEDDGYINSSGVIYRYFHLTKKGMDVLI